MILIVSTEKSKNSEDLECQNQLLVTSSLYHDFLHSNISNQNHPHSFYRKEQKF